MRAVGVKTRRLTEGQSWTKSITAGSDLGPTLVVYSDGLDSSALDFFFFLSEKLKTKRPSCWPGPSDWWTVSWTRVRVRVNPLTWDVRAAGLWWNLLVKDVRVASQPSRPRMVGQSSGSLTGHERLQEDVSSSLDASSIFRR